MKTLKVEEYISKANKIEELFREQKTLKQLDHHHIIRLHHAFQVGEDICLIMDYASGGEFEQYLCDKPDCRVSEKECRFLISQICRAVSFCHQKGIIHRDLKPENILVTYASEERDNDIFLDNLMLNSEPYENIVLKVSDFGIAGIKRTGEKGEESNAGTAKFMAPELHTGQDYSASKALDIWAIGVILYMMIFGYHPFHVKDREQTIKNIIEKKVRFPSDVCVTNELKDLICLSILISAYESRLVNNNNALPNGTDNPKPEINTIELLSACTKKSFTYKDDILDLSQRDLKNNTISTIEISSGILNHPWFELTDSQISEANSEAETQNINILSGDQTNEEIFLSNTFCNSKDIEDIVIPKFTKPSSLPTHAINSKHIIQKLKRKSGLKSHYDLNKIKLSKRRTLKINKEELVDYADKIKFGSNSPNSSDVLKANKSVDECYKNRKKCRKKSTRIIINELNSSSNQMSNGDSDKKLYHRKCNVSVSNSIVKTDEDQDNNFDISSTDHLDAKLKIKNYNFKVNQKSRAKSFMKGESETQQYLYDLHSRFPDIVVCKPKFPYNLQL